MVARREIRDYLKHLWYLRHNQLTCAHPAYEWEALLHGNIAQRWWKRQIVNRVAGMATNDGYTLDIGCGTSPIITRFHEAVGIDSERSKVLFMQRRLPNLEFHMAEAQSLPFADGIFDRVLCIEVIEHIKNPEQALDEMHRVLKPGGQLILATPDFGSRRWQLTEFLYGLLMKKSYHNGHISPFTKESITSSGELHGFILNSMETVAGCDMVIDFRKEVHQIQSGRRNWGWYPPPGSVHFD
jgi:ubiquinone/menaquinone biosynthesis C-methylase UbiE